MEKKYIVTKGDNDFLYRTSVNSHGAVSATMLLGGKELKLYVEPDIEKVAKGNYNAGLTDAWEAAKKIIMVNWGERHEIFGPVMILENIFFDNTAADAIKKIKEWEEKKKQKQEEIRVGDEVAFRHDYGPDIVVVVTYIGQDGFIDCMDGRGSQYAHKNPKRCTKTGRHFPEIAVVLEKMKEGQEQ